MIDNLKYFDGELKDIDRVPADLKARYLTAFDIDAKWIVAAAARRQKWIDQSQSVNLWIKTPDLKTLSHMYRQAWHAGLKTTYYLRSLGASNIEKATVGVKKEMRGAVNEGASGGQNSGDTGGSHSALATNAPFTAMAADVTVPPMSMGSASGFAKPTAPEKKEYTASEKLACSIEAMRNGGECEACQ
jgi:ribonucleoside-diphosphate reductase alpha chain